jgi:hypothetical protein
VTRARDDAPDPCEGHWAFDAISASARRAALAHAARRSPLTVPNPADVEMIESIAALGTAYDLAAGERFDAESGSAEWPMIAPRTAHELSQAATRAFTLLAALPLPEDPDVVSVRRLHLAAVAVIAGRREAFTQWRARLASAGRQPQVRMLDVVWETLLIEDKLTDPDAVREQIAQVREELTAAPTRTASLDLAMRAAAQLNLVTAAGDLLTYRTRGAPTNVLARLATLMRDARRGTPGDREMRALLAWLAYAVAAFVAPLNDQLALPTL